MQYPHQPVKRCSILTILLLIIALPAFTQHTMNNKTLIKEAFEKWAKGTGSFFDLLAPDVVWTITGKSAIAKTYTSKTQFIQEAIDPLNRRFSHKIVPTVKGIYAEADIVIALWEGNAVASDGKPYTNTYSWYMKISGGRIVAVTAFFESKDLDDIWYRIPDPQQ
ncbi:nuclear transport factor 2 family protein [Paraflavitalea pollutisoli]|uniref:nuclear transport factor 2 family protein n=1 Tax=Paraflavitalea pollutisoli TaxID=3034143 RepID=UPI0023EAFE1D|nr:nuclear transport factor 2 family protein [Paraflavitalea sp. H1-2-19X]